MSKAKLDAKLKAALKLDDQPAHDYQEMYQRLSQIAEFLKEAISGDTGNADVRLEPGHLVNAGQQFNVAVAIPKRNNYRDTIFRAYLPASGKPVTLDFFGDVPTQALTPEELEDKVTDFLSKESIRNMVRSLRELAARA